MKPRKEGFGTNGKWVWVPPGGATVLKLVVNNKAKAETDSAIRTTMKPARTW